MYSCLLQTPNFSYIGHSGPGHLFAACQPTNCQTPAVILFLGVSARNISRRNVYTVLTTLLCGKK